jgi:hypothetical protein
MSDIVGAVKRKQDRVRNLRIAALLLLTLLFAGWVLWKVGMGASPNGMRAPVADAAMARPANNTTQIDVYPLDRGSHQYYLPLPHGNADTGKEMLAAHFKGGKPKICGLSEVEAADYVATGGESMQAAAMVALSQAVAKLLQSKEPRERIMGLFLRAHQDGKYAMEAEKVNYPGCKPEAECANKPFEAMMRAQTPVVDELVALAANSRDPDVYAAGVYACVGMASSSCAKLSYRTWAAMDPENSAVWLTVAGEASTKNDIRVREDALRRAAQAHDFNTRGLPLASVLEDESIVQQPALVQAMLGAQFIGIGAAGAINQYSGVGQYCRRAEPLDEAQRSLCNSLVNKIDERDNTLLGMAIVAGIGERLGWDQSRVQAIKDERDAGLGIMISFMDNDSMFGCESLQKANQWIRASLSKGERAAAREHFAKTKGTAGELVQKYRAAPLPQLEIKQ